MSDQVSWQVELAVKPGELDNFRTLTEEMVECTRGEPGVLSYERFVSEDGKVVHVYERYADSAPASWVGRVQRRRENSRCLARVYRLPDSHFAKKWGAIVGARSREPSGHLDLREPNLLPKRRSDSASILERSTHKMLGHQHVMCEHLRCGALPAAPIG